MDTTLFSLKRLLHSIEFAYLDAHSVWSHIERGRVVKFDAESVDNFNDLAFIGSESGMLPDETQTLIFEAPENAEDQSTIGYSLIRISGTSFVESLSRSVGYCPRFMLFHWTFNSFQGLELSHITLAIGDVTKVLDPEILQTQLYALDGTNIPQLAYDTLINQPEIFGLWRFFALDVLQKKGLIQLQKELNVEHCRIIPFHSSYEVH